jgi:hypothetical protein
MIRAWLPIFVLLLGPQSFSVSADEPKRAGLDWWALQPIRAQAIPAVKRAEWAKNPIDAFVLARLEAKGLRPSPPAEPGVLIRRVTFDLTGLPPTPREVDDFVTAARLAPQAAYEKLIDRLLASHAYGERWARHWLDAVRFGESHGFERDQLRANAWRYRDYVIKSFNDDKPYADFVREQIAGDVLTPANNDGIVATGFLVCAPLDEVGIVAPSPSVRARAREEQLEEMLGTVGQTFLGLTVNCARCHDHKFDPVSSLDYYRLKAVFEGVGHGERPLAPLKEVVQHRARVEETRRQIAAIEKRGRDKVKGRGDDANLPRPLARWSFDGDARDQIGNLHGVLKGGAKIVDGRLVLDGKDAYVETPPLHHDLREKTLEAWVTLADLNQRGGAALSIETTGGRTFDAIVFGEIKAGRWLAGSNNHVRSLDLKMNAETKPAELVHIAIVYAANGVIALFRNGEKYGDAYVPSGVNARPFTFKAGEARVLIGKRHTDGGSAYLAAAIDEARLFDYALSAEEVRASFKAGLDRVGPQQILSALSAEDRRDLAKLEAELTKLRAEQPDAPVAMLAYAAKARQPGPTHLLKRGDPAQPAEPVLAGPPAGVKGPPADLGLAGDAPEGERRHRFADWVVHRDNPLAWRVMANRIWQHHFGDGIVRSPNDFGLNGERPTHPELLDWLAFQFREQNGSVKKLHRMILLSAAYRQSAQYNEAAAKVDVDNRLLWRFAPRRLEAEAVRDAMLAASGQLNRQAGGPGFRPFTFRVFNATLYELVDSDTPEFRRRSIYRTTVHSARDPLLDVLDCPDPSTKTPRRSATTTPLQALTLMNNAFVQRQARALADRAVKDAGAGAKDQIAMAYRLALGRGPTTDESARAAAVAKEHGLNAVCWALLNSSEFVYLR